MAETDLLAQAIAAARRGERRRARQMLTRLLRSDKQNAEAWLWMSSVVDSDRERVFCLQSVLKLDPEHKAAQTGLMLLGAAPAAERPRSILSDYESEYAAEAGLRPRRRLRFLPSRRTLEWALIAGAAALLVVCVGLAWSVSASRAQQAARSAGQTADALGSQTATPVPSATFTPPPTPTPSVRTATPTFDPATPLAARLGVSPAPRNVYFETPHPENDAYQAGLRRYASGEWNELIRFMQTALAANPRLHEAHFYIGEGYRRSGRPAEAVQAYGEALRLNDNFAPAYWGRGLAQADLGRTSQALADLGRAQQHDPAWAAPYIERANLYRAQGDLEAARAELISAGAVAPQEAGVHWQLARVLADLGEAQAALREAETALGIDPTLIDVYLVHGRALLALGEHHQARAQLGLYLTYRPEDAEGWLYLAQASAALGDEADALADFGRALALAPGRYEALTARGEYLLELGRYEEALADFNQAAARADTARARLGLGRAHYLLGSLGQAVLDLRRAVNREPQNYQANYWLGRALLEAGQPADALGPLEAAVASAGNDDERAAGLHLRANALRGLGRLEEAAADLQAVLALAPAANDLRRTAAAELGEAQAGQTATAAANLARTPSATPEVTPTATAGATATRTATPTRTAGPTGAP